MAVTDLKPCAKCKELLSFESFGKSKQNLSGLKSYCKSCCNAENRKYYKANKEAVDKKNKAWKKNNKEKSTAIDMRSKAKRPLHYKRLAAAWHQKNMNKSVERNKNWLKENPEKSAYYSQKRRARKLQANNFKVSSKDIAKLKNKPCIYCGAKMEHIDHVIPLARGGNHSIGNLAPACSRCNQTKNSSFVMEWKQKIKVRYN